MRPAVEGKNMRRLLRRNKTVRQRDQIRKILAHHPAAAAPRQNPGSALCKRKNLAMDQPRTIEDHKTFARKKQIRTRNIKSDRVQPHCHKQSHKARIHNRRATGHHKGKTRNNRKIRKRRNIFSHRKKNETRVGYHKKGHHQRTKKPAGSIKVGIRWGLR